MNPQFVVNYLGGGPVHDRVDDLGGGRRHGLVLLLKLLVARHLEVERFRVVSLVMLWAQVVGSSLVHVVGLGLLLVAGVVVVD